MQELCATRHPANQWEFVYYADLQSDLRETVLALYAKLFDCRGGQQQRRERLEAVLEEELRLMHSGMHIIYSAVRGVLC